MLKICDAFGASRFNVPRRNVMQIEINKLQTEINEKMNYLKQAKNSIKDFIRDKVGNVKIIKIIFYLFIINPYYKFFIFKRL